MQSILFFGLLVSYLLALFGLKKISFASFGITFVLYLFWFNHHMTDPLNLNF